MARAWLLALVVIVGACTTSNQTPAAARDIDIGGIPSQNGIVVDYGSVWVGASDKGEVVRIDPASGTVAKRIKAGDPAKPSKSRQYHGSPITLASGFGAIWAAGSDGVLYRIDPKTNDVAQFPINIAASGIAVADDALWIAGYDEGVLVRVDPARGAVVKMISGQGSLQGLVVAFGSLWATNNSGRQVLRFDPQTGVPTAQIALDNTPFYLAATTDAVWLTKKAPNPLARIDPKTNTVATYPSDDWGAGPGIVFADNSLWVGHIARIDPASGKTVARSAPTSGDDQLAVAVGAGSVWIVTNTKVRQVPVTLLR